MWYKTIVIGALTCLLTSTTPAKADGDDIPPPQESFRQWQCGGAVVDLHLYPYENGIMQVITLSHPDNITYDRSNGYPVIQFRHDIGEDHDRAWLAGVPCIIVY